MLPKKKLETLGGIGSILTGLICTAIGIVDFREEQTIYRIWFLMFVILTLNGLAMLRHAAKRQDDPGITRTINTPANVRL